MKLNLPSNFKFYKDKKFESEKLQVFPHVEEIYEAKVQGSTRMLVGTLQKLTKFPLMSMHPQDFRWYLRQLSMTAYPNQSKTVEWVSKYGNEVLSQIDLAQMEVVELPEDFKMFKGYRFPTMSDYCDIEEIDSKSKSWIYEQAQYIDKPTWEERLAELTPERLVEIKSVSSYFFGVREWVIVTDYLFDLDVYLAKCKKAKRLLEDEKENFTSAYIALIDEIERFEEIKLSGLPVEVEPQKVYFPISASILLP